MEDMRALENRRHDNNEEAGLDDDYDEGQEENGQGGQLDPDLVLMLYDRHVQYTLQNNQQNAQFLLQWAGSPRFCRPHSATRASATPIGMPSGTGKRHPRQAETTPRRVRCRTLFHDSLSAQLPTSIDPPRVSTVQPMQRRNVSLQASQVAPTFASINQGETTGGANRSTNSAGLQGELPDPTTRNVSTHVGDAMQQSAQNLQGVRPNPLLRSRRRLLTRSVPASRRGVSLPDSVRMFCQLNEDCVRAGHDQET